MNRWKLSITKGALAAVLLGMAQLLYAQGNPFPCDGRFFLAGAPMDGAASVILSAFPDEIGPTLSWDTVLITDQHFIGPIGFSVLDNHLYALDTASFDILKIDAVGGVETIGNIRDDVDTTLGFYAGCVTPPGIKFTLIGRDRSSNTDAVLYNVRLDGEFRVGNNSLVTQGQLLLNDLAYDPKFGVLYGFDEANRKLVQLSGGLATGFSYQPTDPGVLINGLFFDRNGKLFGYGRSQGSNGTDNTLFGISTSTGAVTALRSVIRSVRSDACSCPYEMKLERRFSPATALPCDTVSLTYTVTNHSGFVYRDISLTDILPPELRVIEVLHQPFGTTISPLDADTLTLHYWNVDLRTDSFVFRVVIDSTASSIGSFQPAVLDSFPLGLGIKVFSSESAESSLSLSTLEVKLDAGSRACFGESITLQPTVSGGASGLSFQWSDGSEEASLRVTNSGLYSVTVSNGCLVDRDSIEVEISQTPLDISLEDQITVKEGNGLLLNVFPSGVAPYAFTWSAPDAAQLSCLTCASPIATPREDVTVTVLVTDAYGCEASDSIRLVVEKIRDIQAPNVFTPNQDGHHDQFFLVGEAAATILRFQVLDRWGRVVYEANQIGLNDPHTGWNGIVGGQQAREGVYFWTAEVAYADESRERFRGNVTLVR